MKFVTLNGLDENPELKNKILSFRAGIYDEENKRRDVEFEKPFRTDQDNFDKKAKWVALLDDSGEVWGSARINIINRASPKENLPFTARQIYECWNQILPGHDIRQHKRAEISNVVLGRIFRNEKYAKAIITECMKLCVAEGVDVVFSAPSIKHENFPKRMLQACEEMGNPAFSYKSDFGNEFYLVGSHESKTRVKNLLFCPLNKEIRNKINIRKEKGVDLKEFNNPAYKLNFGQIDLRNTECFVFDFDQTMVNSEPAFARSYSYAITMMRKQELHVDDQGEKYDPHFRHSRILFGTYYKNDDISKMAYNLSNEFYQKIHLEDVKALNGMLEVLSELKKQGKKIIIISNKQQEYIEPEYNKIFKDVIGDVPIYGSARKPGIEITKRILEENGVAARNTVSFGDSILYDASPILRLGGKFILCGPRELGFVDELNANKDLLPKKPTTIGYAENPSHLLNIIKNIGKVSATPGRH